MSVEKWETAHPEVRSSGWPREDESTAFKPWAPAEASTKVVDA